MVEVLDGCMGLFNIIMVFVESCVLFFFIIFVRVGELFFLFELRSILILIDGVILFVESEFMVVSNIIIGVLLLDVECVKIC